MRILLLGGTTEASELAQCLAVRGADAIFSYAGRTETPRPQPLPTHIGGFGGIDGLAAFIAREHISHVVDATHPFAAGMSRNAVAACEATGTPLIGLERAAWQAEAGDDWSCVADMPAAVAALPHRPQRVFLAIGRQQLGLFAQKPQHFYLLRMVDRPADLPLPNAEILPLAAPMTLDAERVRLIEYGITHLVTKNAGGGAARAKLDAARALGLPVIMVARPEMPQRNVVTRVAAVLAWLDHAENRGV